MNQPHKKDKDGQCLKRGQKAESIFEKILENKKLKFKLATKSEQFKHMDYHIIDEEKEKVYKFEVKAMKKKNRSDDEVSDTIVFVEFKNVAGKNGWLKGIADFIAFERKNDFVIVNRKALLKLSNKIVDMNDFTKKPELYKSYRRWNRPTEHTSMIKMSDVMSLKHTIWKK